MIQIIDSLKGQFDHAYQSAEQFGIFVKQGVNGGIQNTKIYVTNKCQQIEQKCLETVDKTKTFVIDNKQTIFFIGVSVACAYFAPHLFFPAFIITIIVRVELHHLLKKLADEYLRPSKNMFQLHPNYGPNYVTPLDMTMGTIAALDSVALGTLYVASSWTVALLPALGGVAAGNAAAKLGMDLAHQYLN